MRIAPFRISLVILLGASWLALPGQSIDVDKYLREIRETIRRGEKERALEYLTFLVSAAPQSGLVYLERAQLRLQLNDRVGARADLDKTIELSPQWSGPYAMRARLRFEEHDYEGVLADLRDPGGSENIELRGNALIALARYAEALKDFERLMSGPFGPYTNARYPRAICLMGLDRIEEALPWFEVEANEGNIDARVLRGYCLCLLGRYAEAAQLGLDWTKEGAKPEPEVDYDRYAWQQLRDNVDSAAYLRATAFFAEGDFTYALKNLELVPPESGLSDYAHLLRHVVLLRTGKADTALKQSGPFKDAWTESLRKFMVGGMSEKELFAAAKESKNSSERRRCETEAAFYAGQQRLAAGDEPAATMYFERAVSLGKVELSEYTLAKIALKRPAVK